MKCNLCVVVVVAAAANSVYMYDAPPPYPGIDAPVYPAGPQVNGHYPAAAAGGASAPHPDGPQSAAAGRSLTMASLLLAVTTLTI